MSTRITVAVRVRPLNDREKAMKAAEALSLTKGKKSVSVTEGNESKSFNFDLVYSPHESDESYGSQTRVYTELGKPILDEALKGYNQCLFAYGQTVWAKGSFIQ
jgi:hypothetical protein